MESDALQATIIGRTVAEVVHPEASVDVSSANIDYVVGELPKFA